MASFAPHSTKGVPRPIPVVPMVVSGALLPLDCLPSLTHHPWLQDISLVEFEYENIKIGRGEFFHR